jgi:predicted Rossmann-fold nucleotide-binding protein
MHQRKALMADMAQIFVAAPGGIGTLEEFFEIWTWHQPKSGSYPLVAS